MKSTHLFHNSSFSMCVCMCQLFFSIENFSFTLLYYYYYLFSLNSIDYSTFLCRLSVMMMMIMMMIWSFFCKFFFILNCSPSIDNVFLFQVYENSFLFFFLLFSSISFVSHITVIYDNDDDQNHFFCRWNSSLSFSLVE